MSKFQSRHNNSSYRGIKANKAIIKMMLIQSIKLANASNSERLWKHGFENFKYCIHDYLQSIKNWSSQDIEKEAISIEVFEFAYLDNDYKVTICASSNYYGQVAFSDVCVKMDESEQDDYLTDNGYVMQR
ncbi:2985_t:CDS:2 [Gigaspora rosea]|nr:2985_t:CDS:2 [Gigaspora rosea]